MIMYRFEHEQPQGGPTERRIGSFSPQESGKDRVLAWLKKERIKGVSPNSIRSPLSFKAFRLGLTREDLPEGFGEDAGVAASYTLGRLKFHQRQLNKSISELSPNT